MKYEIVWLVKKNPDWTVAQLKDGTSVEYKDVSINRIGKRGEVFPGFDDLQPGREVEGEIWQSPKGGWYLFPPKPQNARGGAPSAFKQTQIKEVMDIKNENIGKVMDRKEDSIRLAGAQRDAVLIVTTLINQASNQGNWQADDVKKEIIKWRNFFLLSKDFNEIPPFE